MVNNGNLFLIPNVIAANTHALVIPPIIKARLPEITHFLAENIRTARRYLSALNVYENIESLSFSVLDKDTKEMEVEALFAPLFAGNHLGVLSESGCPGIADPGALAARFAHQRGIEVIPLVGPSSLVLSLMASGLNGQQFAFQGYLPIPAAKAAKAIRELERESRAKNQTQIFIETPFRNPRILDNLLKNLMPGTQLCIAVDVTGDDESILTQTVKQWRLKPPPLSKKPAVFLFLA